MPLVNSGVQTEEFEFLLKDSEEEERVEFNKSKKPYLSKLGTSFHSLKILQTHQERWMSIKSNKCLFLLLILIGFGCFGLIVFSYYCSAETYLCGFPSYRASSFIKRITRIGKPVASASRSNSIPTFDNLLEKDFQFDIEGHDVMVFLHMQKTGGTAFGKHLVKDLELARECVCHRKIRKRCTCLRPNSKETWLFSRYSTGWKCGLHADWTELTSCVDEAMNEIDDNSVKRRYFYISYLREPIHRYLSEYRHVRRGATWKDALLFCDGQSATEDEVPHCYKGEDWMDASLEEFLSCKHNLANNRQTRMLADLQLVNCYNTSSMSVTEREAVLLASAKTNLQRMAFFGLTEMQPISQYLFEETFNLKFNVRFSQFNETLADDSLRIIEPDLLKRVREINHLDVQLYKFAKELLKIRYKQLKTVDKYFEEHFRNMGHMGFSWDDIDKDS